MSVNYAILGDFIFSSPGGPGEETRYIFRIAEKRIQERKYDVPPDIFGDAKMTFQMTHWLIFTGKLKLFYRWHNQKINF